MTMVPAYFPNPFPLQPLQEALRLVMAAEAQRPLPAIDLSGVNGEAFLAAVERHRLEIPLATQLAHLRLSRRVEEAIQERARLQRLAALPLTAAAMEVLGLLEKRGVRALVFKGPALALQTCHDITARGGGDLDLLVDPQALAVALACLEQEGFVRLPGFAPRHLDSLRGRYARWAMKELPLVRGPLALDLHWVLTNMGRNDPSFEALWNRRVVVEADGASLRTLCRTDALVHSCAHAVDDRWIMLRSLIDIDRLMRQCSAAEIERVQSSVAVQLSAAVTHAVTGSPSLELPVLLAPARLQRALGIAWSAQQEPQQLHQSSRWDHHRAWLLWRQRVELAASPVDLLRGAAEYALPPAVFSDPRTGGDLSAGAAVGLRLRRVRHRLGQWLAG
jgi:hypothetical protein